MGPADFRLNYVNQFLITNLSSLSLSPFSLSLIRFISLHLSISPTGLIFLENPAYYISQFIIDKLPTIMKVP